MLAAKSDDVAGHFEKAIAEYREALRLAPDQLGIHLALGQLYAAHLQWTAAADEFKSEIALDHANAMAKAQLAHAYIKMHQADPAITLLTELLKNSPRDAEGYADLGEAWEQKRETRNAIVAYEHAL